MTSFLSLKGRRYSESRIRPIVLAVAMCAPMAIPAILTAQDKKDNGRFGHSFEPSERGDRGPRGGFGAPPRFWSRISDEEREQVLQFVDKHFPKMYVELERLRGSRPEGYQRRMGRIVPEMWHLMDILDSHPQRGKLTIRERQLDMEMWRVARQYRAIQDQDRKSTLRSKMRTLNEQAFDLRHRRRELQILDMERRIAELKQRQKEAARSRDQIIETEVEERLRRPMPPTRGRAPNP